MLIWVLGYGGRVPLRGSRALPRENGIKIVIFAISQNWLGVTPKFVRNTPYNLGMPYLMKKELGPNSTWWWSSIGFDPLWNPFGGVLGYKIGKKSRISRNWLGISPKSVREIPHNLTILKKVKK